MIEKIYNFIKKNNLIKKDSSIVVGLSGGPDSVFLLHILSELVKNGSIKKLTAAHLDHEWRTDSHKDIDFCNEITKKYNTQLITAKISNLSISHKFNGSKEEVGRIARRYFFEKICKEENIDLIALAHHAQDQQETFFIRLIRGATLSGLTAMKSKHGRYIRPLLEINKSDIIKFLKLKNIPFLIDPSNESDQFLRNRIRNYVLPAIKKVDVRFDVKFKEALDNLKEIDLFLESETKKHFNLISIKEKTNYIIDIKLFLQLNAIIRKRILLHWLCIEQVKFPVSKPFFSEITRFLEKHGGGTHNLCPDWSMIKKKGKAYIKK